MVHRRLPETEVNTSQSASIMIVCTFLESDFDIGLGLYYLSLHLGRRPLVDIRTSRYESNMYVWVTLDITHPHSRPSINHRPHEPPPAATASFFTINHVYLKPRTKAGMSGRPSPIFNTHSCRLAL